MNDIYTVLTLLETIPLGIFMVCLVIGGQKRWGIITRFFAVIALLIFNILQLPIEIHLEQSTFFSIFLIITWTLYLIVSWCDFWRAIRRK